MGEGVTGRRRCRSFSETSKSDLSIRETESNRCVTVATVHRQNEVTKARNNVNSNREKKSSWSKERKPTLSVVREIEDSPCEDIPSVAGDGHHKNDDEQLTEMSKKALEKDEMIASVEKVSQGEENVIKRIFFWSNDSGRSENLANNDEWEEEDPDEKFPVFQMTECV